MENEILDNISFNETVSSKEYNYPLSFEFKIGTLANDFSARDANGVTIAYVRQKLFKLKGSIDVYSNEQKSDVLYQINADKIIGFNMNYAFTKPGGENIGRVARKGVRSLWKANYQVFDGKNNMDFTISELNPWAKVMDSLLGEVPVLSILTGYLFNPKYGLKNKEGKTVAILTKEPSFWGRKFKLEKTENLENSDSEPIMLSLMMMLLIERRRG